MDFSRFKPSDWLKIGGAAGMLIFGLFGWVSGAGASGNAFDFTLTGAIPWLLIVAVGVLSFLLAAGIMKRNGSLMWDAIILIAAALGALLVVIRLIIGPEVDFAGTTIEFDRGFGLYVSAIACVACAVGAYLGFTEQGGNIAKLPDAFKSGTGSSSGMAPPPPPGGSVPPPPPPPAR